MLDLNNKYNILSIDDNKNNLFTLNALLKNIQNINNIEALSAQKALNILLKNSIDLILCDVQMPEINGFEFARMIKSNKKTKDIPIIFITAVFKSEEFIKEGFTLGAVDYLTKPIDDNQLINKIMLYLKVFKEKDKAVENEKLFYDIAQSIGDGIYTLDKELMTTFINDEALKLLGFKREELIGKRLHDYIHYKNSENKPVPYQECLSHVTMVAGTIHKNENEFLIKKDGSFLPVAMTVTPLLIKNEIVGTVIVFRDKTDIQKIDTLKIEKRKNQEQIIYSMVDMIESRDSYTAGHTRRVAKYCTMIAKEMGYSPLKIELLENAAWLHDIGKISTPDNVLLKPGRLTKSEYDLIKEHLNAGYDMLSKIDQYKPIADIMREHHEKYDGSGYPRALKAEAINPLSRIMMVADAFDAMTTNRVYKSKKSVKVAIDELKSLSGIHFHPEVVNAAKKALKDITIDVDISQLPKTAIEEHRFSYFYRDRLTDLFVMEYLHLILKQYLSSDSLYMYDIKLHNFTDYNQKFGWKKGDEFLISFASFLRELYAKGLAFRVDGDDFLLLSESKLKNIEKDLKNFILFKEHSVSFSVTQEYVADVHLKFGV